MFKHINLKLPLSMLTIIAMLSACGGGSSSTPAGESPVVASPVIVTSTKLALINATIIDGSDAPPLKNATVLIDNGRILSISDSASTTIPADFSQEDLTGQYLIPGLIDGHTHITSDEGTDNAQQLLTTYFKQGITSIRDMAGNGTALKSLRNWSSAKDKPATKVYFSALVSGPDFLSHDMRVVSSAGNSTAGEVSWMPKIDESTNIISLVSAAKNFGVTGIKLYADISPTLATLVIKEAQKQGIQAWAHAAVFKATPNDLLQAGVDAISHANLLLFAEQATLPSYLNSDTPPEGFIAPKLDSPTMTTFFETMKSNDIVLDATLLVTANQTPSGVLYAKKAKALGVMVSVGTDNSGTVLEEMKALMNMSGFSAQEAIIAATRNNAYALGIEKTHGTIATGKTADLVVLTADPLSDINNMSKVSKVIKEGHIHYF